jgi:hypothetical protein
MCPVCGQWPTTSDWLPFCCEVCWDSADAEMSRDIESGKYDDLLFRFRSRPDDQ